MMIAQKQKLNIETLSLRLKINRIHCVRVLFCNTNTHNANRSRKFLEQNKKEC